MKVIIFFFILCINFSFLQGKEGRIVRRAALDIGSATIKMQVSDVDLATNKIAASLFSDSANIRLGEDLAKSPDGNFSLAIQNDLVKAVAEFQRKAAPFQPEAYHGIATEALRLAKNGPALIERIKEETGVTITIIPQEEEGILGFMTAVQTAQADPDTAISWDQGAGSFQVTVKEGDKYHVYRGKMGSVPVKDALCKIQNKPDLTHSPNPISAEEAEAVIKWIGASIADVPETLRKKLNHPNSAVIAIGIHPLWRIRPASTHEYDKGAVLEELKARLYLDDDAIDAKDSITSQIRGKKSELPGIVSNLILFYGIMDALDIHQVKYAGTLGGNSTGVLLSPRYWEK